MATDLDLLFELVNKKFTVIPMVRGDMKAPLIKLEEWKEKIPDIEQVRKWLGMWDSDWAVMLKGNLCCVDIDEPTGTFFSQFFEKRFGNNGMQDRTPSGGRHIFLESAKIPKNQQAWEGWPLDLKGSSRITLVNVPPAQGRSWVSFSEPEQVDDIEALLESLLPNTKSDYKKRISQKTNLFKHVHDNYADDIAYESPTGDFVKMRCFLKGHTGIDEDPSLVVYKSGNYYCFGCGQAGGLFSFIKQKTGKTDQEILKDFPGAEKSKPTLSDSVIEMVENNCKLIKDQNNSNYLLVDINSMEGLSYNLLPIDVKSKLAKFWMNQLYENMFGRKIPANNLNYACDYLAGKALAVGERKKIFKRIGGDYDNIWYDNGDNQFVHITKDGIRTVSETDIIFFRENGMGIQQAPNSYEIENVWKLFDVMNIYDKGKQILILAWLLNALLPSSEYPILQLHGPKGSGKSRAARFLKRQLDPMSNYDSELSATDTDNFDQLINFLSHGGCIVLDNISNIDQATSDLFCMVVTGGVVPKRELYTTNDQVFVDIKTRCIITGINREIAGAGSGDLSERIVSIELERPEGRYISNEYLDSKFEEIRFDVLGGLFKLASLYLKENKNIISRPSKFRMITFANVGQFLSEIFKDKDINFEEAYMGNQMVLSQDTLEIEPITAFIRWYVDRYSSGNGKEPLRITITDLYQTHFKKWLEETQKGDSFGKKWPQSHLSLGKRLVRIIPDLRKIYKIVVTKEVVKGATIYQFDKLPQPADGEKKERQVRWTEEDKVK